MKKRSASILAHWLVAGAKLTQNVIYGCMGPWVVSSDTVLQFVTFGRMRPW